MLTPHVVYHIASMGNWHEIIKEQFALLRDCGLAAELTAIHDTVGITHLGPWQTLDMVIAEAKKCGVPIRIVKSDQNTDHYETLAMLEIEWLAKSAMASRSILYMHTKGVSNPADPAKRKWRKVMEYHVVSKWRENVGHLESGQYDAAGFNWWNHGCQHFSGTFWIARADWIRRLPSFVQYHNSPEQGRRRYSCELWIGAAQYCRAYSHGLVNGVTWASDFPFHLYEQKEPMEEVVIKEGWGYRNNLTIISAATFNYRDNLFALANSAGGQFSETQLIFELLTDYPGWRHERKLRSFAKMLKSVETSHVIWLDADCVFQKDEVFPFVYFDKDKPLSAVRHFLYSKPQDGLPERLWPRLPEKTVDLYWQACLWGGAAEAVKSVLESVAWIHDDERGYDEHALNIEFQKRADQVHTLPCRYASPESFDKMPASSRESYEERAGGPPIIIHRNREISR